MRSWLKNKIVKIRNPNSTRPWQHVLEVIFGYLTLAINLKSFNKLHESLLILVQKITTIK